MPREIMLEHLHDSVQIKNYAGAGPLVLADEYANGVTWNGDNSLVEYLEARAVRSYENYYYVEKELFRSKEWQEKVSNRQDGMTAIAADGKVILSNEENYIGANTEDIRRDTTYMVYKQVGFTPFELLISYEVSNHGLSILFMVAMLIMAVLLLVMLEIFLQFWKKKFFVPIQTVISEVEELEGVKGAVLPMTGIEHFDGLVHGINDMVERIEQKEKEAYKAESSLQKAEIKKQKAMIISLKKQISAHFTVNVLNIIKALSSMGENEKAGLQCDGLSFLLRYANVGDTYISGMEEFLHCSGYFIE